MKQNITLGFLPGWASDQRVWFTQERYFSSYRIIHINYYRDVNNPFLTGQKTSLYGESVLGIIKGERHPVILVGWSLGAMVALESAIYAPEKILGMVLVGGTARFINKVDYDAGLPGVVVERMKKRLFKDPERTLNDFYMLMFTQEEREKGLAAKFQELMPFSGLQWSPNELQAGLDYLKKSDFRDQLKDVRVSALIVHGEKDEICPIQAGQHLHDNIERSLFKPLPDCGHLAFMNKAHDFNDEVGRWMHGLY